MNLGSIRLANRTLFRRKRRGIKPSLLACLGGRQVRRSECEGGLKGRLKRKNKKNWIWKKLQDINKLERKTCRFI
jgi:hypothetical protein